MSSSNSKNRILEIIKEQEIKPIPRWRFTAMRTGGWFLFLLGVFLGGLAFSVILYAIQQTDFKLKDHFGHSGLEILLSIIPFVWLILVISFFLLSIVGIRNSWGGYKLSILKQTGWSIALSMALGTIFFIGIGGSWLDNAFGNAITDYQTIEERKTNVWSNPNEGMLSGIINEIDEQYLTIMDFKENEWTIEIEETWIAPPVLLEVGEKIKLLGEKITNNQFKADEIRPWGGRHRMRTKVN